MHSLMFTTTLVCQTLSRTAYLLSVRKVEQHISFEDIKPNPLGKYVVPEMTYALSDKDATSLIGFKTGISEIKVRNFLFPIWWMEIWSIYKSFLGKLYWWQLLTTMSELEAFPRPGLPFEFRFHKINVATRQFPVPVAFIGTVHKAHLHTLIIAQVHLCCPFFSPRLLNVTFLE